MIYQRMAADKTHTKSGRYLPKMAAASRQLTEQCSRIFAENTKNRAITGVNSSHF